MQAPGPLSPTRTTQIPAPAGALYGEVFVPTASPRGVVLVTHGYAEHCGRYHELAHVIVSAGWAVLTYDVRGHGQSPGARGFIDRFQTYLDDLAAAREAARALAAAPAPLVLLGHSHGGLITLRALAGDAPPRAEAAIISSPYLGLRLAVPGWKKTLARVASRIAPGFKEPNRIKSEDLTSDPQKRAEHDADKQCFDIATARWFTESSAAQAYVAQHAERIQIPTTWFVGGADALTDPDQSRRIADRVTGAQYHDLAGLKHEVFNELDRARVFQELTKTLASCSAPRA